MWIEINWNNKKMMVNIDEVQSIHQNDKEITFHYVGGRKLVKHADSIEEAQSIFAGMRLVLNGLCFVVGDDYIKPILACRNEKMYEYIKLKEVLGDVSKL